MPQLITVVYPYFQSQKRTRPQTMAGSTVDWELSRGMIGACVSKLRVVSWITIDWHKIAKHRMRTGNGSATMRSGETRVSGRLRSITGPAVNIVYAKTSVVVVGPIYSRACVYLYQEGQGTPLRFTRRFTSRLGGRFISTLMSQLEAAGISPFSGRGPVWFPRAAPECPLRGFFLNPMISLALPRSPVISDRVSMLVCGASTTR